MIWLGKVIKTDPTQIILACIIGYITDLGHLTFPLPLSEKLPVHTNPFSGFVLLQQQPKLRETDILPFRCSQAKATKMCFILCFCTITGWRCTPCSICILRGDNWETKLQGSWNTEINHLSALFSSLWTSITPGQSRTFWAVICFITRDDGIRAQKGSAAWLPQLAPVLNNYW